MKKHISKNLIFWFVGLFIVLLLIAAFSFNNINKQNENHILISNSYKTVINLNSILSAIQDVETGTRGYVITGNKSFLNPFYSGLNNINDMLLENILLQNGNTIMKKEFSELHSLVDLKIELSEEIIKTRNLIGIKAAMQIIETGKGNRIMNKLRTLITEMIGKKNNELIISKNETAFINNLTFILISASGVFSAFMLVFVFVMLSKELKERAKVESDLRQSESTLHSFYNSSGLMMGIVELKNDDILVVSVNKMVEQFRNEPEDSIKGKYASAIDLPKNYFDTWLKYFKECEQTEKPVHFEILRVVDNNKNFLSSTVSLIEKNENGNSRFSFVVEDITDRKKIEHELKNRERLLNAIIENMPVGVWIADKNGMLARGNKEGIKIWAGAKYVGIPEFNEYKGWWASNGKKIEAEEWALARAITKGEVSIDEEIFIECFDNTCKTILNSALPIYNDKNEIEAAIVINQDISQIKKIELALRERERTLKSFFDSAGMLMGILELTDNDIELIEYNKAASDFFKLFFNKLSVKFLSELNFPDVLVQNFYSKIKEAEASLSSVYFEFEFKPPQESKWLCAVVSFIERRDNHSRFAFIVEDRTANKKLESELETSIKKLKLSNIELEQFAFAASHDLQSPLRSMSGFAQLMLQKKSNNLDDEGKEFLNMIIASSKRMQKLIKDLLYYSRVGKVEKLISINVSEVIDEIMIILTKVLEEKNAVITYDALPIIFADKIKLIQLFQNLIENGIKYNNSEKPTIHISAERINEHWKFAVKDNGIGIDEKHFERIFLVFQRLHLQEEYDGTGIGLSLCKKIIDSYNGKIWVESNKEFGSTFYFTIPDKNIFNN